MIKKLTFKELLSTVFALFFCLLFAVPMLWYNGPAALEALSGSVPELAKKESLDNIYVLSLIGLFFAVIAVIILIRQMTHTVKKRVKQYLAKNPSVTLEQLDSDFAAAEEVSGIWIGKRWTFSHKLDDVVLDNDKIIWVFSETVRSRRNVNYYVCFRTLDGEEDRAGVSKKDLVHIQELYEGMSHVVVGNSPEYGYLFKNDREAFLDLKYRQKAE